MTHPDEIARLMGSAELVTVKGKFVRFVLQEATTFIEDYTETAAERCVLNSLLQEFGGILVDTATTRSRKATMLAHVRSGIGIPITEPPPDGQESPDEPQKSS